MSKTPAERQKELRARVKAKLAAYDALKVYDIHEDEFRHVTPFDLDLLHATINAYAKILESAGTRVGPGQYEFADPIFKALHSEYRANVDKIKAKYGMIAS